MSAKRAQELPAEDLDRLAPFLRWAGGKRRLANVLASLAPDDYSKRRYLEPFLGAASIYFKLLPSKAVLSDANAHLIQCYAEIRDRPAGVARHLRRLARKHGKKHYYQVRDAYNSGKWSASQAARFIYLNQTCFNGVFRVNKRGEYNVPLGRKKRPRLPSTADLKDIARQLKSARLVVSDYEATLSSAKSGDFIYLDPPYPALNGTAYFAHYTAERFSEADQKRLALLVRRLAKRGCLIMVSNADVKRIRRLYAGFTIRRVDVTRFVSCKKKKHRVREVVITNY